jgi:hypothetical protein
MCTVEFIEIGYWLFQFRDLPPSLVSEDWPKLHMHWFWILAKGWWWHSVRLSCCQMSGASFPFPSVFRLRPCTVASSGACVCMVAALVCIARCARGRGIIKRTPVPSSAHQSYYPQCTCTIAHGEICPHVHVQMCMWAHLHWHWHWHWGLSDMRHATYDINIKHQGSRWKAKVGYLILDRDKENRFKMQKKIQVQNLGIKREGRWGCLYNYFSNHSASYWFFCFDCDLAVAVAAVLEVERKTEKERRRQIQEQENE